ncbi:uncharacterized protein LOC100821136 isoform X2 [Brachypodium distachyon]|uniref:FHA domain-containing protein n=1 Tax=Brachypodium distachyon TaxID=15368 RepID=I1H2X0_BRADI|nr:uncharacterized protein LOC100821136 isoform X2 [Brachypodium distachyon]KQK20493.1 hypothetical protein BRADI_1g54880v3 [Brachypodium distachyon]|eukprot:XP_003557442.1 uncharacterized protein LOC100821136 isoform X2 [Brachypodium distachyon]
MGVLSAGASWDAKDDLLLKNAVEAGASLESLAKGAVCFSCKFTLQELQDRWRSLLYDSVTSAQASARIVEFETELSTSSPGKTVKLFNSKGKGLSLRKRKIDSVKLQYYSRRKRVCHEPCLPANFGYAVAPCSCIPVGSSCVCGGVLKPSEGNDLVHRIDSAGTFVNSYQHIEESYGREQDVHHKDNQNYVFHPNHASASGSILIDGNINDESLHGCSDVGQLYICDNMEKNPRSSERKIAPLKGLSDLQDYAHSQQPLFGDHCGNGSTGSKILLDTDQDGVEQNKGRLQYSGLFKASRQQLCSRSPSIHTWSKFEGSNSPDMQIYVHKKEQEHITFFCDKKMEVTSSDTFACLVNINNGISNSGLDNASISGSDSMHDRSVSCSLSQDFELLNGKKIPDSALDTNHEECSDLHTEVVTEDISRVHLPDLSDSNVRNTCDSHIDPIHKKHSKTDVYGTDMVPTSSQVPHPGCSIECRLNTEDSEIPCNDDALMPGQPPLEFISTCDQKSQHSTCLVSTEPAPSKNVIDSNHTDSVVDVQPSSTAMKMVTSTFEQKENMVASNEAYIIGSRPPVILGVGTDNAIMCMPTFLSAAEFSKETTCGLVQHECVGNFRNLTLHMPNQVSAQKNSKFLADKPDMGCETAIQNSLSSHALLDIKFQNPIATMSSSDQAEGGSDIENSVPNYFDIEALILDQDLIPWDEESDFVQPEVSRFQHLESRKKLIRLEQGARSYMNRSIMSQGAFAIIYGRYLKYYIKDPEVTLGRETEEVHVDIDLAKEGNANKISRRQAVIKMDAGGSFHIKNIGRYPIFVNGKEVPCNKRINLISDALLEIRGMKFIFHVDPDAVRQHIILASRGSSEGKKSAFDWDQNP